MYYILNETNQIIAADDTLLHLCGVSHIDEILSKIIQGEIKFDIMSDTAVTITTEDETEIFSLTKTSLSSMLGNLTLVDLLTEDETEETTPLIDTVPDDEPSDIINSIINEESIEKDNGDEITLEDHLSQNDDIMDLKTDTSSDNNIEDDKVIPDIEDDSELFSLVLDDVKENEDLAIDMPVLETEDESKLFSLDLNNEKEDEIKIDTPLDLDEGTDDLLLDTPITQMSENDTKEEAEIDIDVKSISHKIGISTDDYNNFLNEFIDTALSLEKDLQSSSLDERSKAITTLTDLIDILHLPVIGDILDSVHTSEGRERETIESFYSALSRITTSNSVPDSIVETIEDTPSKEAEDVIEEDAPLALFDEPEPMIQETVPSRRTVSEGSFGTISLEGIKPKHFDFQLEEAATDLSLPVELIEEFVQDFIEQAHIETKKMLEAYENGDFDAIKAIGHLLKGASSNLRINALSDTLYKIQFCEDSSNLEPLIKDYWAHFLSFENQINVISN